jgi:hypothetical protein
MSRGKRAVLYGAAVVAVIAISVAGFLFALSHGKGGSEDGGAATRALPTTIPQVTVDVPANAPALCSQLATPSLRQLAGALPRLYVPDAVGPARATVTAAIDHLRTVTESLPAAGRAADALQRLLDAGSVPNAEVVADVERRLTTLGSEAQAQCHF